MFHFLAGAEVIVYVLFWRVILTVVIVIFHLERSYNYISFLMGYLNIFYILEVEVLIVRISF